MIQWVNAASRFMRYHGLEETEQTGSAIRCVMWSTMMEAVMRAVEATGTIDEQGALHLDQPIKAARPGRVRVLLLIADDTDIDEHAWMRGAATNPAFDFLDDVAEDIYTRSDGRPFHDEG